MSNQSMTIPTALAMLLLWPAVQPVTAADFPLVAAGAKVKKLAGGFKFTEGPARDRQGNIFFSDYNSGLWAVRLKPREDEEATTGGS